MDVCLLAAMASLALPCRSERRQREGGGHGQWRTWRPWDPGTLEPWNPGGE